MNGRIWPFSLAQRESTLPALALTPSTYSPTALALILTIESFFFILPVTLTHEVWSCLFSWARQREEPLRCQSGIVLVGLSCRPGSSVIRGRCTSVGSQRKSSASRPGEPERTLGSRDCMKASKPAVCSRRCQLVNQQATQYRVYVPLHAWGSRRHTESHSQQVPRTWDSLLTCKAEPWLHPSWNHYDIVTVIESLYQDTQARHCNLAHIPNFAMFLEAKRIPDKKRERHPRKQRNSRPKQFTQHQTIRIWNERADSAEDPLLLFLSYICYFLTPNSVNGLGRKSLISHQTANSHACPGWAQVPLAGLKNEALRRSLGKGTPNPRVSEESRGTGGLRRLVNC